MPYTIRKVRNKSCYRIINKRTKKVFSKCATKENAAKQLRLLRALQYNKSFVPLNGKRTTRKIRR
jgi:hypothetical protein